MLLDSKDFRNLLLYTIAFVASFQFSYSQETEVKPESTAVEEIEITENIEITNELELEVVPFAVVDNAPYPSQCKDMEINSEKRKCTIEFIQKHTLRKFNTDLGKELGLSPGKKRVIVQFKVDVSGKVIDIRARAPHPDIGKEAERVIQLLPEFTPGVHQGETVVVSYTMPIVFYVHEEKKKKNNRKN